MKNTTFIWAFVAAVALMMLAVYFTGCSSAPVPVTPKQKSTYPGSYGSTR